MRLPFLQVDQDAWARARALAARLAIPRREALGMQMDLWQWGLEMSPEDQPITGVFEDESPAELLAGVLEFPGDPKKLWAAMVSSRIIDGTEHGFRIRGLPRYNSVLEEREKDAERKRLARELAKANKANTGAAESPADVQPPSGGRPADVQPESTRQTHTHTHTQEKQKPAAARAKADEIRPPAAPFRPPAPQGDDPEFIAFFAQAQDDRSAAYPESIPEPPPRKSWDQWADFKAKVPDPQRRRDTWRAYLEDPHAKKTKPPCCWSLFASQPHKYVPGQDAQAPPPDDRPPCSACDQRKETAVFNGRRLCYRCAAETQRATA